MRTEDELRRAITEAGSRVPGASVDARQAVARRVRHQRTARLAPVALVATAVLAFGVFQLVGTTSGKSSVVVTSPSHEQRPEPTTAPPPSATAVAPLTAHPRSSADPCLTRQLAISAAQGSGAGGHGNVLIVFRNTGPSCRIVGYPGVAALDAHGSQLGQARRTATGFFGGLQGSAITPQTVQLVTGGTASAVLEGLNAAPPDGGPCPSYAGLLVTPPAQTESTRVPVAFSMCGLQIHPVVPGSDGGTGTACADYGFKPQSSDTATSITAYATTCAVARSVVAAGPDTSAPNFGKDYTANGFTCAAGPESQPSGGGMAGWAYACSDRHGAEVTFDRHA